MPESGATPVPKGSIRVAERFHARSPGPEPSDSRRSFWSHIHGAVATMVTRHLIMRAACVHRLLAGLRDVCGGKQRISLFMGRHLWGLARGVLCVGGVALGRVHGVGDAPSTCMRHGTWERPLRGPRVPHIVSKAVLHYHENKNGNASQNTALSLYPPSCPPASAASWLGRSTRRKRLRTALGERPGSNAAIAAHFCPRRSTW